LNSVTGARISRPNSRFPREVPPMARTNPVQFVQQVRAEVGKVVWPSRREVVLTTVMVFIMAALTATFFSLVDLGIRQALSLVLNSFG
jgi:preprotein translocase subunit SecE